MKFSTAAIFAVSLPAALVMGAGHGAKPSNAQWPGDADLEVGSEVCTYGFIMDYFCIERGTLLDMPAIVTLQNPQNHTLHCLLDVPQCWESTYHILQPPAAEGEDYGTGWAVSDNTPLIEVGRQQGSTSLGCTTCPEGEAGGTLKMGFRAEVMGTVVTLDPPVLDVTGVNALGAKEHGCKAGMKPMMGSMGETLEAILSKLDMLLDGTCPDGVLGMHDGHDHDDHDHDDHNRTRALQDGGPPAGGPPMGGGGGPPMGGGGGPPMGGGDGMMGAGTMDTVLAIADKVNMLLNDACDDMDMDDEDDEDDEDGDMDEMDGDMDDGEEVATTKNGGRALRHQE